MIDYLIIGAGLAGIAFAEQARRNGKKFLVADGSRQSASVVAGGIYNPIVLKRFKKVSNAESSLEAMHHFFDDIRKFIDVEYRNPLKIYRRFSSIEEQNDWFAAADKFPGFLIPKIIRNDNRMIAADFGFGEVSGTGYVDTKCFVGDYREMLSKNGQLIHDDFDFDQLKIEADHVSYKDIKSKHIVFAEGMGLQQNPFFNDLPLQGTKGELLMLRVPDLRIDVMIKAGVFIMPLGGDLYKVGSTYDWTDKSNMPTAKGKAELLDNFEQIVSCPYEVVSHLAGIRPTVKDRKPLVGTHHVYQNVHVLNGLGSRGVMLAPKLASDLFQWIENGIPLQADINIRRFDAS